MCLALFCVLESFIKVAVQLRLEVPSVPQGRFALTFLPKLIPLCVVDLQNPLSFHL